MSVEMQYFDFKHYTNESLLSMLHHICQLKYYNSWEGSPILAHGREVPGWWSPFLRFSIRMGPYFMTHHNQIDSLCLQKRNQFVDKDKDKDKIKYFINVSPYYIINLPKLIFESRPLC